MKILNHLVLLLIMGLVFTATTNLQSQCVLVCKAEAQISMNNCEIDLSNGDYLDSFLEAYDCPAGELSYNIYETYQDFENDNPLSDLSFDSSDLNKQFFYVVSDAVSGNVCWGQLEFTIFSAPETVSTTCDAYVPPFTFTTATAGAPLYHVLTDNDPTNSFGSEDEVEMVGFYEVNADCVSYDRVYVYEHSANLNGCGAGTANRIYALVDANGVELARDNQFVEIATGAVLPSSVITWPENITVDCEYTPLETGEPIYPMNSCNLLASTYEDVVFTEADSTYKVIRTWTVIDWCTSVVYEHTQIINTSCNSNNPGGSNACDFSSPDDITMICDDYVPPYTYTTTSSGTPLYHVVTDNIPVNSFGSEDEVEMVGFYEVEVSADCIDYDRVYVSEHSDNLGACGTGTVNRIYALVDANGIELARDNQLVEITSGTAVPSSAITWPADITVDCEYTPEETGEPSYPITSCNLLAAAYEDTVINETDSTYKVIRTWTLLDWCTGTTYEHVQIINTGCNSNNPGGIDCNLYCNAYVNISLPETGSLDLLSLTWADMFLEGANTCPNGVLEITLYENVADFQDGIPRTSSVFTIADDGQEFYYNIEDTVTGNACWGVFLIEYKFELPVHPGDTDNDGVANQFDLLNVGLAFGAQGNVRANASFDWTAQISPDWNPIFANGLNYKHADCDGNGIVDLADIEAIELNWNQTHNLASNTNVPTATGNPLDLFVQPDSVLANAAVSIPINLGTMSMPATDVYGVAFSITYDPEVIVGSPMIDASNSWLGTIGTNLALVYQDFQSEGRIDVALTRTDGMNASGYGAICAIDIIIEDVIFFQQNPETEDFLDTYFTIDNVRLVNSNSDVLVINTPNMPITIMENTTSVQPLSEAGNIKLFPNPAIDRLIIESPNMAIDKLEVYNVQGQFIQTITNIDQRTVININDWKGGFYLIKVHTQGGVYIDKVLVLD